MNCVILRWGTLLLSIAVIVDVYRLRMWTWMLLGARVCLLISPDIVKNTRMVRVVEVRDLTCLELGRPELLLELIHLKAKAAVGVLKGSRWMLTMGMGVVVRET